MRIALCALLLVSPAAGALAAQRQRVLVEEVRIEGNRRLTAEELLARVRTRPGDPYDEGRMQSDFRSLLDLGLFDPERTRVFVGEGLRGGKVVTFEVAELPLVDELKVGGRPRGLPEADVLRAAGAGGRGLRVGGVYGEAVTRRALAGVRAMLAERGLSGLSAACSAREVEPGHVSVVIEFTEGRSF